VTGRAARTVGAAIGVVLLLLGAHGMARAQESPPTRRKPEGGQAQARSQGVPVVQDTTKAPIDTAAARLLGLPTQPSRTFPPPDSTLSALLKLEGYDITRYAGDSITLFGATREIVLVGSVLVEKEGSILEAGDVEFQQSECRLDASGLPRPALFDQGTVLVGDSMRYDTCLRRGTIPEALTSFDQSGVTWYLRGGLEVDSASTRIYGASNEITSCDHPEPHYYLKVNSVKWVSNDIMVARPAILYVRDVPVLWVPFFFQDVRPGRKSGMLVPRFGFSDLVRPSEGYQRHVSNIGYYFAISDYFDFQASIDWWAGNYVGLNGQSRYRWLNRFMNGQISASWMREEGEGDQPGARSIRLQWNHQQSFDQRTRLTASVDYATSAKVVERNTVDPFLQTSTLTSRLNFSKQFGWGTLSLGGSYTQDLSSGTITQTLPSLSLTPSPIQLWSSASWSPSLSVTNGRLLNQSPGIPFVLPPVNGVSQIDTLRPDARTTQISFRTPFRVGRWNWANDVSITDTWSSTTSQIVLPDPANPDDSITRFFGETFQTGLDWNTGINLPAFFPSSWKLQPSVGIRNTTGGPFLVRTRYSNGQFVSQGKRLSLSASLTPTLFGFFPGFGPLSRIRHGFSPQFNWSYSPAAQVPEEYVAAIDPTGKQNLRESPALMRLSFSMSNSFEGKLKQEASDTAGGQERQARKVKLLSIQTSPFEYDFEQAKKPGYNGFVTKSISNQFTSDLLPGFSLAMAHDLWNGPVGIDTTKFDPFMTSISARFTLSERTFKSIFGLLTGGPQPAPEQATAAQDTTFEDQVLPRGTGTGQATRLDGYFDQEMGRGGRGFQASFTYDDQRQRPGTTVAGQVTQTEPNRTLGWSLSFSPTPNWSVAWNTQYNITLGQFGQHVLRLERTLHRWRATFAFLKAPNGNFAFNFYIALRDQPEMKLQYDQRTGR